MSNITELETKYIELGREIEKLKTKEDYPKFFRGIQYNFIVKFTTLTDGVVVYNDIVANIGNSWKSYVPHTNKALWEEIPYDKTTGFYHTQLVWSWNNENTHERILRFYDAINKRSFTRWGVEDGAAFGNYEAYDWSCDFINEWAIEAVKTLENK